MQVASLLHLLGLRRGLRTQDEEPLGTYFFGDFFFFVGEDFFLGEGDFFFGDVFFFGDAFFFGDVFFGVIYPVSFFDGDMTKAFLLVLQEPFDQRHGLVQSLLDRVEQLVGMNVLIFFFVVCMVS